MSNRDELIDWAARSRRGPLVLFRTYFVHYVKSATKEVNAITEDRNQSHPINGDGHELWH